MPEQVVVEKIEALYIRQVERLEKQLANEREERHREREMLRSEYQERLKESIHDYRERKEDLIAQNDGMLGAIGRLHAENLALKTRISEFEFRARDFDAEMARVSTEAERCQDEAARRAHNIKEEAAREIKALKKELEDLRAKKKS